MIFRMSIVLANICMAIMMSSLVVAKEFVPIPTDAVHVVTVAKTNLSQRLLIDTNNISLLSIEYLVWPDTCLGLPAVNLCARTVTPGYKIVFKANSKEYIYHTDKYDMFRYVE